MIPWNPIHRYAGMTSLFDELDEQEPRDVPQARIGWGPEPTPERHERAPLGFVDVRAEAASNSDADEGEEAAESDEALTLTPPVGFAAADETVEAVRATDFLHGHDEWGARWIARHRARLASAEAAG